MILVDTSVWVDFLRGPGTPQSRALHSLIEFDEDICITEVVLTEILQGARSEANFEGLRRYLLNFPIYRPKGTDTYIFAAEIYRRCRRKGRTVRKTIDCIIAAICLESDLVLLHSDSDFEQIEGCVGLACLKT